MNRKQIKQGIQLFLFFAKIGCFTFGGGWSILAQMEQEFVDKRKMITKEELLDIVSVGKSIPGIMITNISMIFGYQAAGWFGGICSVFGIAFPAVVILAAVTICYQAVRDNQWVQYALTGIRCAVAPIIISAVISLGRAGLKDAFCAAVCLAAFVLCSFLGFSNIGAVLTGLAVALIRMEVKKHGVH
ncbi:MAG: chromate transporter [Lachnospiraceae bacterium]|nr:chromate transporter [Lachnospiraceae bacterium]